MLSYGCSDYEAIMAVGTALAKRQAEMDECHEQEIDSLLRHEELCHLEAMEADDYYNGLAEALANT